MVLLIHIIMLFKLTKRWNYFISDQSMDLSVNAITAAISPAELHFASH